MLFATNEAKTSAQSLLAVYFQAVVYYDQILSYFCLAFQYLLFIYKYNVLYYSTSTIAGELILLTLLLLLSQLSPIGLLSSSRLSPLLDALIALRMSTCDLLACSGGGGPLGAASSVDGMTIPSLLRASRSRRADESWHD